MKKIQMIGVAAFALIGCGGGGGSSDKDAGGDGAIKETTLTDVSGFTIDIDKLGGVYGANPNISAQDLIAAACVANTPVHGEYEGGGTTATVKTDASCAFTVKAEPGKRMHMVSENNTDPAFNVMQTYSQESTVIGTAPLTNVVSHICTSNNYSAPVGFGAVLGLAPDQILAQGACMFGTDDHFMAPFAKLTPSSIALTETGYTVYANADPTTQPPTFTQSLSSPSGIYGITKAGLTGDTTIHVTATATTGTNTYAPNFPCTIRPGAITFAPTDPTN